MAVNFPKALAPDQLVALEKVIASAPHPARDRLIVHLTLLGLNAADVAGLNTSDFACQVGNSAGTILLRSNPRRDENRTVTFGMEIAGAYRSFLTHYPEEKSIAFTHKPDGSVPSCMTASGIEWMLLRLALEAGIRLVQRASTAQPVRIAPRRAASRIQAEIVVLARRRRQIAIARRSPSARRISGTLSARRRAHR